MPAEEYMMVTISNTPVAKLAGLAVNHDLGGLIKPIDLAAGAVHDPEALSEAMYARLLYQKLTE